MDLTFCFHSLFRFCEWLSCAHASGFFAWVLIFSSFGGLSLPSRVYSVYTFFTLAREDNSAVEELFLPAFFSLLLLLLAGLLGTMMMMTSVVASTLLLCVLREMCIEMKMNNPATFRRWLRLERREARHITISSVSQQQTNMSDGNRLQCERRSDGVMWMINMLQIIFFSIFCARNTSTRLLKKKYNMENSVKFFSHPFRRSSLFALLLHCEINKGDEEGVEHARHDECVSAVAA